MTGEWHSGLGREGPGKERVNSLIALLFHVFRDFCSESETKHSGPAVYQAKRRGSLQAKVPAGTSFLQKITAQLRRS